MAQKAPITYLQRDDFPNECSEYDTKLSDGELL